MKKWLLITLILLISAFIIWKIILQGKNKPAGSPPVAITVNSTAFNISLKAALDAYIKMSEGFVNWDSTLINTSAGQLLIALDSLKTEDLRKDSAIYLTAVSHIDIARTETQSLLNENNWKEKRGSLNVLSQNFYDLLRSVQYDIDKIYYQECPMAFGEDSYGYWVSTKKPIRNPYLGTSDPQWGRKMLNCGATRDSLKFFDKKANQ